MSNRSLPRMLGVVAVAATLLLVLLAPTAALAKAQTFTEHFSETEVEADVNPCSGVPGTVTIAAKGVAHFTLDSRGGQHFTFTVTGDFSFVPDDPGEPSYTGRFTIWGGGNDTAANDTATFTFNATGKGSDGSKLAFSSVAHITAGEIDFSTDEPTIVSGTKVAFEKFRCA